LGVPGVGLKGLVHGAAVHGFVEVHFKSVKVGAVHAGEPGLAAHGQAAAAAHAGAVHHDGVHGNDGLDVVGFGGPDHEFHHDQGADGDDFVKVGARLDLFLQRGGDDALLPVGTVVGD